MRNVYVLIITLFTVFTVNAQTDISIGSGGTTGNSGTSYPAPLQDFYEGSRAQYLYLASELTAAGMTPGNISEIKFNVTGLNTFTGTIEQLTVSMGNTSTQSLTNNSWETGATTVFGPVDFTPVVGQNSITFTTPFFWNGADNIVVEICNGDPNNGTAGVTTYTQNVSVPWTTGLTFNGSHTYRADNLGNLCGTATTTNSGTQTTRPDITFVWTPSSTTGCYLPSGTAFSNITSTSATVSWNPPAVGSTATGYTWELRTSGAAGSGSTGLVASGNLTATTANLTSLTPITTYYFYIKTDCGSGNVSIWSGGYNFTTLCAPISSFSQNFDGVTTPNLPQCWSKIIRGATVSTAATVGTIASNSFSSPNAVALYNSGSTASDDIILVSPSLSNLSAGTYQLSFYARNSTLGQDIEVGTLDDNTSTANFTSLQTVTLTTSYQKYTVSFSTYSGTDTYIGLRRTNGTTFSYVYLDNISWELIPSCVEPSAILISNIGTTSAQVDWTAPATSSPSTYELYYSTNKTAPTSTTTPTILGITGTTSNLTGLTSATQYYVWVRSNCGSGGTSIWSGVDSFFTQCNATNLPYTQNFESASVPNTPPCTSTENVGTGNNWATINNPGNGFTSNTLRYAYNTANPADVWFYTQGLNLTAGTSYRITFKYGCNSATYTESMNVSYGTSPSATAMTDLIVDYPSIKNITPLTSSTDFTPSTSGVYYIGFHAYSIANQFYLYVDDISVDVTPLCSEPTALVASNITTNSAQVDWTAPATGTPSTYELYYSTNKTAPTSTTTPSILGITGTTANLTGLTSATQYYVWVRSNCGTGGTSIWSVVDSLFTQCNATNIPYTQNFESATVPAVPPCTSTENVGTGNNWETINNPGNGFTTKTLRYAYNTSNPADVWFYTQGLNLTAGTSYRITFKYGCNSATYTESMNVSYGTSPSASAMTDLIVDYPSIKNTTPAQSSTDFTPSATGVYYIGFHAYSIANQFNLYVDDISVDLTPLCSEPTALVASNITATSAQIDWTAPATGTPSTYELYYSTNNTAPTSTTTPSILGITGTTSNLTGLTTATQYYVWVRSNCGTVGTSAWSVVDSFTTSCIAVSSFSQSFDSVTVPALPKCWSRVGLGGTGVRTQSTSAASSPNTVYIYSSSTTSLAVLAMQTVTSASTNTNWLRFDARGNFTAGANIEVGYLTNPSDSSTFVSLQTVNISTLTYQNYTVTTGPISGADVTLAFRHTGSPSYSVLIDNVVWEVAPSCTQPTTLLASNITATDAQIDWTAPAIGSPASYDVYYSTNTTPPTSTTTPTISGVTTTTVNLTGLSASSSYCVWVRSNCGTNGYSVWSSSVCFNTTCGTIAAPSASPETFAATTFPPNCWTRAQGTIGNPTTFTSTTTSGWVQDDFTNRTNPVNKSAKLNIYGTTRKEWLFTPAYNLGSVGNLNLEFDLALTTWNDTTANTLGLDDKFAVVISTDGGLTWSDANILRSWDATTPISSTGEHIVINLSSYTGTVMFGFYGESTISNADNDLFVDNVTVSQLLPVTLTAFKGEKQGLRNLLTWSTSSELNNKGFEVQRSINGTEFSTITFVKSKSVNGTSNAQLQYSYVDEKPFTGNNYYRLKQVDFDGKSSLSKVVLIKSGSDNELIVSSLFPNPAKGLINLITISPFNQLVNIVVTDVTGKNVLQQSQQMVAGENTIKLPISNLRTGMYFVKVLCNNGCKAVISKFIKE